MRLDTHVHTSPGSRCSVMSIEEYLAAAEELGLNALCITNHGDISDYDELLRLAPAGLLVIPGVEISSIDGDFLIFSTELDWLRTLKPAQPLPQGDERPYETAVVWAHPFAGAPGGDLMREDFLERVARQVDGIEVFNGNWPDEKATRKARRLAAQYSLAELGGSDSHRRLNLMRCWTQVDGIGGPADLIRAIRSRTTAAFQR